MLRPMHTAVPDAEGLGLSMVSYNVTSLCCSNRLDSSRVLLLVFALAAKGVSVAAIQEGRWRHTGCTAVHC
eukprot:12904599-Prorocentrum_lima.AAC.1